MTEVNAGPGLAVVSDNRRDGTSYLLIPLVQRPTPLLPPLREQLRAWVTVVTQASDPCIVLDAHGRVAGMSRSAAELVGEQPGAVVGRRLVGDVFVPVDFSSAAKPIGDRAASIPPMLAISAGVLSRGLVRLRHEDGVTVTLDMVATPLHTDDGEVIGSLSFAVSLSKR